MNSALERIGARIVCVHSFSTRAVSRRQSAARPRWWVVAGSVVMRTAIEVR